MLPMMENQNQTRSETAAAENHPQADDDAWQALYDRIRMLALRRSSALAADETLSEDAFDRGARALRTLMGAAEIARRIKQSDAKEKTAHEEDRKPPAFTDEEIEALYETVSAQVDRIERQGDGRAQTARNHPKGGRHEGGRANGVADVEAERA